MGRLCFLHKKSHLFRNKIDGISQLFCPEKLASLVKKLDDIEFNYEEYGDPMTLMLTQMETIQTYLPELREIAKEDLGVHRKFFD